MFHTFFKDACLSVREKLIVPGDALKDVLPADFITLIEEETVRQFTRFQQLGSSKAAHHEQISLFRSELEKVSSEDTCLCCIRRRPQTGLQCRHSTCHVCVRIFNHHSNHDPRLVPIKECMLCGMKMEGLAIKEQPETATLRVLSFDGGGMRGIAEIESLMELERRVALPYPVIKNFDICYATSCGEVPPEPSAYRKCEID